MRKIKLPYAAAAVLIIVGVFIKFFYLWSPNNEFSKKPKSVKKTSPEELTSYSKTIQNKKIFGTSITENSQGKRFLRVKQKVPRPFIDYLPLVLAELEKTLNDPTVNFGKVSEFKFGDKGLLRKFKTQQIHEGLPVYNSQALLFIDDKTEELFLVKMILKENLKTPGNKKIEYDEFIKRLQRKKLSFQPLRDHYIYAKESGETLFAFLAYDNNKGIDRKKYLLNAETAEVIETISLTVTN